MRLHRLLPAFLLFAVLVTTGAGCGGGGGSSSSSSSVELNVWRVFDDDDTFETIISSYRLSHPNVKINYKKLRFEEYKDEVIRAIAAGEGPDILSVHNTWMGEFQDFLEPMPDTVTVSHVETRGTLRKETVMVTEEEPTMSMKALKQNFVSAVVDDVVLSYQPDPKVDPSDEIFGLPMSVDTLALFYNADLLAAAGIAEPPTNWKEFQDAVKALTSYDDEGDIRQSGAALGTSDNVERSVDLLSVLMMQSGTQMLDDRGRVVFDSIPEGTPDDVFPTLDALEFYTDFADPTKDVYTWNSDFPNSFEAFANGQTAMFFGYSYHIPLIRTAAPKLNFAIAPLPQISDESQLQQANYANYWIEGVAKSSEFSDSAWDFVLYATDAKQVTSYLETANKPTALRSLITTQIDNEDLGPFAEQLLTAKSWYRGTDVEATEKAMNDLIDTIAAGPEDPVEEISDTASVVRQTY